MLHRTVVQSGQTVIDIPQKMLVGLVGLFFTGAGLP